MENVNLDHWLEERGMNRLWAETVVNVVRKNYPTLTAALKAHKDVVAELELMKMVHDIETNVFLGQPDPPGCHACAVGDLHTSQHPES
jgi:hypothetical protein